MNNQPNIAKDVGGVGVARVMVSEGSRKMAQPASNGGGIHKLEDLHVIDRDTTSATHFEAHRVLLGDSHGGDMNEWPKNLRVRQFPEARR